MNIIVVGCGKVGAKLCADLCREGHDVTVVDKSDSVVNQTRSITRRQGF